MVVYKSDKRWRNGQICRAAGRNCDKSQYHAEKERSLFSSATNIASMLEPTIITVTGHASYSNHRDIIAPANRTNLNWDECYVVLQLTPSECYVIIR